MSNQQPQRPQRSYILWSGVGGVFVYGLVLTIFGLTGIWRTRYQADPVQPAILLVADQALLGVIPGLAVGVFFNWWTRRNRSE